MAKSNNKKIVNRKSDKTHKFVIKNLINNKINLTFFWTLRLIISIIILYISYIFAKKMATIISVQLKKDISHHKKLIIRQLSEIVFYIIFGFGVFISLINMGVQTTTIITLLGTVLVTIGFALQGTLSNVFSGIYVALSENFQIGDVIHVYVPFISNPIQGKVIDFNIAYVKLQELNTNKIMYLPNTCVAGNVLVNMSQNK